MIRMPNLKTKIEQFRQALSIHGSVANLCLAGLAIKLARVRIPSRLLRTRLYGIIFGKKYTALNEAELEQPMWAYPSFNALFTRGVKVGLRPMPESGDHFLCPCDGRVQDVGRIEKDKIITVKGIEYTIDSLLAGANGNAFLDGHYAIIFLSPADCHRIFSPQDGHIDEVIHVPGSRLLVHPPYQKKEYPVFALNERVILRMRTRLGSCALILVAGWGVGHITFPWDRRFKPRARSLTRKVYDGPLAVNRGTWIATFELGSTAILLTEPAETVGVRVERDEKVNYGQPLFSLQAEAPRP
jgi:phosphatidylserine decarboxylase